MHRLYRPPGPACLNRYQYGKDSWSLTCPNQSERKDIWAVLETMQGKRCAYCEGPLDEGCHIEHFRQRSRHPQGTFDWSNLFGSCNRRGTCGDHKDSCGAYPHQDLIKPDVEDPEALLIFLPNGTVRPRNNLSDQDFRRAETTIDVLQLDGSLNQIRRSEVSGYIQTAEAYAELAQDFPEEEWLPGLQQEIQAIADLPYATAIRHVLTCQSK